MSSPQRPSPGVEIPVNGGVLLLAPFSTVDHSALITWEAGASVFRTAVYLTRAQGTALRDALTAWLDTDTPAPAASRPVPQAVTGTAVEHPAAAPVARAIGICARLSCEHAIGEHDTDYGGECTATEFPVSDRPPLQCSCPTYVPAGGAS